MLKTKTLFFKTLNNLPNVKLICYSNRCFHRNVLLRCISSKNDDDKDLVSRVTVPGAVLSKYEAFREDRAPIILDVEEERRKLLDGSVVEEEFEELDPFAGISRTRGVEGVIDIEEVVEILRRENAEGLFVAKVPPEYHYVKYIVIVNGKSVRHMVAMAEFIRRVYKYKRNEKDFIPTIEGKESKDWIALDLGNIALHIFSRSQREVYDLESLWSVGKEHDKLCNKPEDPLIALLKQHSVSFSDLTPADSVTDKK